MNIKEIVSEQRDSASIISDLKKKSIIIPSWSSLEKEYNPQKHPVVVDPSYKDKVVKGSIEKMTRITLGWQKLAVKRMTELMFAIPVQRVYKPENENEKLVAEIMESVFSKNRLNSVNIERGKELFASCEVFTLWYSQEQPTEYAKQPTTLKLRCKNFSPMEGTTLYPLFDEYDDLIAMSLEYSRTEDSQTISYFETYTDSEHIIWRIAGSQVTEEREKIEAIGKIPGVYICRPEAIWEDQSENVYEAEWTLSRNGNYIRKNARPNWVVFSDNNIQYSNEPTGQTEGRNVLQYGANDKAQYVTWQQATESIKFHIEEIKRNFFMQLQLPDMSMDNMKATPMSGEARKMMFIDAQMKVTDESGAWLEMFDREINVVRAFLKTMYPNLVAAIDALKVETIITPYQIRDEAEKINNLSNATGGKPIMSQRTAVANLGYVDNVDEELKNIADESSIDLFDERTL